MPTPHRSTTPIIIAVAMVVLVVVVSSLSHPRTPHVQLARHLAPLRECSQDPSLNDAQLNQCLIQQVAGLRSSIDKEQRRVITVLDSVAPTQGRALVPATAANFDKYVKSECLTEAAFASGGTLYPILYGECEVSLYGQRLELLRSTGSLAG